ncbi:DEAD/DEAH box helicase family protein [Coleofasciculus sp. LEGE 07081]|uniref:helicase-related protein n=1 Tax=Coleofasciculus sp. LEGE 07081 TaxID=2777967 RepID=UPI0018816C6F|nr:helicase-related protein [Coleofasciculus sp. LEGE 07081]MBE9129095.1 DEAD/DEAH box helicase family protein [Coleofasciculus sp. LEGE 07081]
MSDNLFTHVGESIATTPSRKKTLNSGLRDNHSRGTVVELLKEKIASGSDLSIVSAYFTIYAYACLKEELDEIKSLRFLFGEPRFINSLDPEKTDKKSFQIEDTKIQLANRLEQKQIALECARWIEEKVQIRSVRKSQLLHGKMYHIDNGSTQDAILGSSNFTQSGIGAAANPNIELNIEVDSKRELQDLKNWFDELWNDQSLVEDVKGEVLHYLEQIFVDHDPEFIYFKTLYHVFEKFLLDQESEDLRFRNLEIVETDIWKALFDFQRDGVKGAINKINAHNGCILADSVGLGKTYTALGVIKYFELRNYKVLVLCPKKLRENWTVYLAQNASELNPFAKDRFNYTVLSHTDLSRECGKAGDIDLTSLNWSNFDLVVIDESHNFRNNTKGKRDEDGNVIRKSRYERLMEDIIQKGVKTKVLLLSATPVNNDLKDLRNQIYFVTEGQDTSFADGYSIKSIKDTLNLAQRTFTEWAKHAHDKDTKGLMEQLPAGFFTLLDEITIARSRKHIKRYYNESVKILGDFPRRRKPVAVFSEIDAAGKFISYDSLNDEIDKYQLSLFNPFTYVMPEFQPSYELETGNFTRANLERFLVGMMKVNFLKRLESSIKAFEITMDRTVRKIEKLEKRLAEFKRLQSSSEEVSADFSDDIEPDDAEMAEAFEVGKVGYKMEHLFIDKWMLDLEKDRQQLERLRDQAREVTPERDAKLCELKRRIEQKVKEPSTNKNGDPVQKLLIFTAFADTAEYLFDNLRDWARNDLSVHIAMVSGGAKENQTTYGKADFTNILVNFSPRAKQRDKMPSMAKDDEITILIATDCISEGQNLQDCDLLINYDIHWNPVRIIQRFGRIDRIGSINPEISLVNFWPTPDLNKYINLKNRVEARMALVDLSATAEDNLLDPRQIEDLIESDLKYRDKQLLRLQEEILDLEDFHETPSLNEFTLDDFRMELANYIEANKKLLQDAPLGLYSVVPVAEDHLWLRPGVIFCLRQTGSTEGTESVNPLQPYYLVYVHDSGDVRFTFSQPKQILELMRDLCAGHVEAIQRLCDLFNEQTQNGADMSHYSQLLKRSTQTILDQFAKRSVAGLLSSRDGTLPSASVRAKSADDFELITWLVIRRDS